MAHKTKLYRRAAGLIPFATVQIGNETYTDDKIMSIEMNYGKSGQDNSVEVATATIEIAGHHPMSYNQRVVIKVPGLAQKFPATGAETRFVGRVGNQTWGDRGDRKKPLTKIVATSGTVRLFRSDREFNFSKNHTMAHMVNDLSGELKRLKIDLPRIQFSGKMWTDSLYEQKTMDTREIMALLEKNSVVMSHLRTGGLLAMHPQDMAERVKADVSRLLPIQRSEALAPAEHSQPISYIDQRVTVNYRAKGIEGVLSEDWTRTYLPVGADYPTDATEIDMTELEYDNGEGTRYWRYGIRAATFRSMYLAWQTPSIKIDLLHLLNGTAYDKKMFRQIVTSNEGDSIIFGGDWSQALQGPKIIQGYTESITPDGWEIAYSLADPRMVFGYSSFWLPLPAPPAYTWAQATHKSWNTPANTTWEEVTQNGIR